MTLKTLKYPHEPELDILRGFAAIMVLFAHVVAHSDVISKGFDIKPFLFQYIPSGYIMVIVFFLLSGYVMAMRYSKETNFEFRSFISARAIRLYPIYLFTILVVFFLLEPNIYIAVSSVFFLQLVISPCFSSNTAMWSLNHEILYYILFGLLKKINSNFLVVYICVFFTSLASVTLFPVHSLLEAYSTGFFFWMSGYLCFTLFEKNSESVQPNKILAMLFLLMGADFINVTGLVGAKLSFLRHGHSSFFLQDRILFQDVFLLPICIFVLLVIANRKTILIKFLYVAVYGLVLVRGALLLHDGTIIENGLLPLVLLCFLSLFCYHFRFKLNFYWLTFIGSLSYALYLLHVPIYILIGKIDLLQGTGLGYLIKIAMILFVTTGISYLLEIKIQPFIKRFVKSSHS